MNIVTATMLILFCELISISSLRFAVALDLWQGQQSEIVYSLSLLSHYIPGTLLSLYAGWLADRFEPKRILGPSTAFVVLSILAVNIWISIDPRPSVHIYWLFMAQSGALSLQYPILVTLIKQQSSGSGTTRSSAAYFFIVEFVNAAAPGLSVLALRFFSLQVVAAFAFAGAFAALILFVGHSRSYPVSSTVLALPLENPWRRIWHGIRLVVSQGHTRLVVSFSAILNFAGGAFIAQFGTLVLRRFPGQTRYFAAVEGALAVGAVGAALFSARWPSPASTSRFFLFGALYACGQIAYGFAQSIEGVLVLAVLCGAAMTQCGIQAQCFWINQIPPQVQGVVTGATRFLGQSFAPIGVASSSVLCERVLGQILPTRLAAQSAVIAIYGSAFFVAALLAIWVERHVGRTNFSKEAESAA